MIDFSDRADGNERQVSFMTVGTVKWFSENKGFGYIARDGGSDVFIHYSQIEGEGFKTLYEGEKVEFEVTQGEKGPQAFNARKIN